ncbi:glycosyltransferase [Marinobacterium litorale]|uniref:glycosyltransferase n=1 Tax=Marinobacterium litorale TaxID=404770 RepID=UPI000429890C|nr:glycosyltransferase [Marinobacterium litorale]
MTKPRLRALFYLNALIVALLVIYKIYLNFFEQDFSAIHATQVERIEAALAGRDEFRFAVVGNINNSIGIFERKIIPRLNSADIDFMISAGDAVSSGGEDKYRALYRTLSRLEIPYLLTFGENENSRLGGFRFYDHFGPYLFSFAAGNSRFIFLDSTGKTSPQWQLRWLEEELQANRQPHTFLFSDYALRPVEDSSPLGIEFEYLFPDTLRNAFVMLAETHNVDTAFSTGLPLYVSQQPQGTRYIMTGGGGGFVPSTDQGFYHYTLVTVNESGVSVEPVRLDSGQHPIWRTLEGLWFFIHSLFYVGYLNFILLVSALVLVGTGLYSAIFVDRDYYPSYDVEPEPYLDKSLRIAMFTNNYLPFIGGVPISIDRLRRGLKERGHQVRVVAPGYDSPAKDEDETIRAGALLPLGKKREFRLANIFEPRIYTRIFRFKPDLIHVHHPFWLGSAGLFIARRLRVPAIYTYHTRLEHYAHYVPLPGPLFRNLVSHSLVRRFANRCDGVIVPTESAEEYLRMIGVKKPVFVQPTGIEFNRFRDVPQAQIDKRRAELKLGNEKVLISISRLSREKDIDFLIEGLLKLKQRGQVSFRCLILGDGQERERLERKIATLDLANQVQLLGAVPPDELAAYCRLGDLFVFASRSETQGMVVLEAMAAGMPVVAVRSSGIDDIVTDDKNGYKTAPDRSQWCDRVESLLLDDSKHQALSSQALDCARAHSVENFSAQVHRIYACVLAQHSSSTDTVSTTQEGDNQAGKRSNRRHE